ncbi:hypothetical protein CEP54_000716 [Fusarium duplospermum]|uniref:Uncharacterized protein n=1 Tax=Fusarium duplospermum TaxID=1325734 RepID=A0A428R5W0_9HYPO|nr:hypothetical protein CEP54_000716 [Fusarium duplospermum]
MPPLCPRELRSLALNPGGNLKRALGRDPTGPGKCPQAPTPRHSAHSSRPTVAHSLLRREQAWTMNQRTVEAVAHRIPDYPTMAPWAMGYGWQWSCKRAEPARLRGRVTSEGEVWGFD